jgi:hypothetical protein
MPRKSGFVVKTKITAGSWAWDYFNTALETANCFDYYNFEQTCRQDADCTANLNQIRENLFYDCYRYHSS